MGVVNMSDHLRPWLRPPESSRFVSDSMIRRAELTPFQVAVIEEILLEKEVKKTHMDIDSLETKIRALKTEEGVEAERRTLINERNQAVRSLAELKTADGVKQLIAMYLHLMERYELQNVEREKILETLRSRREKHA